MKQQQESTDMEITTESNKEIGINKPTAFDGSWKKVEMFIQKMQIILAGEQEDLHHWWGQSSLLFVFYDRERGSEMEADLP